MNGRKLLPYARGEVPVDLLLSGGRIVDVFSGEIVPADIAIAEGHIVGLGVYPAKRRVDLGGRLVAPGFIDAHVHIESAMTGIGEFARTVVAHGTTAVAADPHEIANVLGLAGIDYMLAASEGQPVDVRFTLPSCVPATHLETSGARLSAADLEPLMAHPRVLGLGEMMNYPGVIHGDAEVHAKIQTARRARKTVDGHAPALGGRDLSAYVASGIGSDHECTTADEALEKLRAGMHIMIREGTGAKNLQALLPLVTPRTAHRMMWCTDDRHPHDLMALGSVDAIVREAVQGGLDPVTAIQMATLNPAEYFRMAAAGAVAPGRRADLVVFSDLSCPTAEQVYTRGVLTAENGVILPGFPTPPPVPVPCAMHVRSATLDFAIPAAGRRVRVIEIVPGQIVTRQRVETVACRGGQAVADTGRDILKIAVVERHTGSGHIGRGLVSGFKLHQGALASSVAHDAHNIIVVGVDDTDMRAAVQAVVAMGGGLSAACDGEIRARLPLPVGGLMSDAPLATIRAELDRLSAVARGFGTPLADPFMTLSFLALPVIPSLKITDKGLVDVSRFEVVPLFVP